MGYQSFAVTVPGGSHSKEGKGCQDFSGNLDASGLSVSVAADGHGDANCFRSDRGAKFAVLSATSSIRLFSSSYNKKFVPGFLKTVPSRTEFEAMLRQLLTHIITEWHTNVETDYTADPFTAGELEQCDEKHRKRYEAGEGLHKAYGTTLLAAAVTDHYWFGLHIGDGRFTALYPDGSFDQPVPWDEKCYLNVTTSLCDDDARDRARSCFAFKTEKEKPFPASVFLCSDGIDDNYPVDENEKHLFKLYRTIALTFFDDGFESTCAQLQDLATSFATKGKGDDTSIAGFVDMAALKKAAPVWRKQIAEEDAGDKKSTAPRKFSSNQKVQKEKKL